MRVRPLDAAAILFALVATAAFSMAAYTGGEKNPNVLIQASGQEWIYPLREDRQVTVSGPLGEELIRIEDGKAFVEYSPCPNQICIQQGKISKPGQWIACLPNKIFIRISGTSGDAIDDISS